jgi:hypothetical protein
MTNDKWKMANDFLKSDTKGKTLVTVAIVKALMSLTTFSSESAHWRLNVLDYRSSPRPILLNYD